MTIYNVNRTRSTLAPIRINPKDINSEYDVTLFGRERLAYGEEMNENLVGLLENFACPENTGLPGSPDLNASIDSKLSNPLEGQLWYNTTQKMLFRWDGSEWIPLSKAGDVAGNWGVIADGEQLPQPVNPRTGVPFPYSKCVWIVSPFNYPDQVDWTVCSANSPTAVVRSRYRIEGGLTVFAGFANYMIVGIEHNQNLGETLPDPIEPTPLTAVNITGDLSPFCTTPPFCQASTELTASPVGGNAGYLTYLWTTDNPSITIVSPTSQTCQFISDFINTGDTDTALVTVQVTDTFDSVVVSNNVTVDFSASDFGLPPPPLVVALSDSSIGGVYTVESCGGDQLITTESTTANVSGGTAPYTYQWEFYPGITTDAAVSVNSPTGASTTFSSTLPCDTFRNRPIRVKVTDASSNIAYSDFGTINFVHNAGGYIIGPAPELE